MELVPGLVLMFDVALSCDGQFGVGLYLISHKSEVCPPVDRVLFIRSS